jgi:ectoine hydroxylase-related dioxygenase (phytanoyl-CoA dioxygenase family)
VTQRLDERGDVPMTLTRQQVLDFERDGYLVIRDLLDVERDLAPVVAEYEVVLDDLARDLHARGEIADVYEDLPFGERMTRVYADSGRGHVQHFDFSLPLGSVTPETPIWTGPAVFAALRNERILDVVESLIGPEIFANPIQHVRIKPPEHLVAKDLSTSATVWHQDQGVTLPEADETEMLTVWFGLSEATEESGCLHVRPGSHRMPLLPHCPTGHGPAVPEAYLPQDYRALPVSPGDVILLHRRLCHGSLPNRSDVLRWSFDLRYHPVGQPTGRPMFPGFVARSRSHPETELRDAEAWAASWQQAKKDLLASDQGFGVWRWDGSDPLCA